MHASRISSSVVVLGHVRFATLEFRKGVGLAFSCIALVFDSVVALAFAAFASAVALAFASAVALTFGGVIASAFAIVAA